jgi:integrase
MAVKKTCSQHEILAIIRQIEQENFILANAARMAYFAGFHKNEIENIKIKDVFRNNAVLSQIEPFLEKARKAYTILPMILDAWPRRILDDHIKQLKREG